MPSVTFPTLKQINELDFLGPLDDVEGIKDWQEIVEGETSDTDSCNSQRTVIGKPQLFKQN